ncbi:MAG: cbb3-type cytochrome c oxidase subunit I [Thermoproteota archaeon]|nr:cbb3-type cytochrome c oxidase subunit I [Thermoproteota archaeon]
MTDNRSQYEKQFPSMPQYDVSPELKKLVLKFMVAMVINFVVLGSFAIGMRIIQADIPFPNTDPIPQNVLFYSLLTAHGQGMIFGVISANTMWFGYYAISKWGRKPLVGIKLAKASFWIMECSIILIIISAAMGYGGGWYDLMPLPFLSGTPNMAWGNIATILFLFADFLVGVFLTIFCIVIIATALKGKIAAGIQHYEDKEYEQRDGQFYDIDDQSSANDLSEKMENLPSAVRWVSLIGIGSWFTRKWRSKIPQVSIVVVAVFVTAVVQIVGNPGLFLQVFEGFAHMSNPSNPTNWFLVKESWWFFGHPIVYFPILVFLGAAYFLFATSYGNNRVPYDKWNYRPWPFYFLFSLLVFNHHIFMDMPLPTWLGLVSQAASMAIVFPSGLTLATILHHIYRNKISWNVTTKFLIIGIMGWAFGGLQGATTGVWGMDIYQHNTMAMPGHIHFMMLAGALPAAFGILYAVIPDLTKKQMNKTLAEIHFWGTAIGIFSLSFLFTFIGMDGAVRREADMPSAYDWAMPWLLSFALIIGITQFIFVYNFFNTLRRKANDDEIKEYDNTHKQPKGMGISPSSE